MARIHGPGGLDASRARHERAVSGGGSPRWRGRPCSRNDTGEGWHDGRTGASRPAVRPGRDPLHEHFDRPGFAPAFGARDRARSPLRRLQGQVAASRDAAARARYRCYARARAHQARACVAAGDADPVCLRSRHRKGCPAKRRLLARRHTRQADDAAGGARPARLRACIADPCRRTVATSGEAPSGRPARP